MLLPLFVLVNRSVTTTQKEKQTFSFFFNIIHLAFRVSNKHKTLLECQNKQHTNELNRFVDRCFNLRSHKRKTNTSDVKNN